MENPLRFASLLEAAGYHLMAKRIRQEFDKKLTRLVYAAAKRNGYIK